MQQTTITDEYMKDMLTKSAPFTVVILKKGPNFDDQSPIIWEHGRRNFSLRADGRLAVVCPVRDGSDVTGVGIFNITPDETSEVMNGDPGVQAGLFVFETHQARSFPGDMLPAQKSN